MCTNSSKPYLDFVHPDDKESTLAATQELVRGVPVINFSNRYICKDGTYKWIEWTSMPDPRSGVTYAIARDITDKFNLKMGRYIRRNGLHDFN